MTILHSLIYFFILQIPISYSQDIIQIEAGMISGLRTSDGLILSCKGIPFAAPPVGDLRWSEPQQVPSWLGVRDCSSFGPSPIQGKPVASPLAKGLFRRAIAHSGASFSGKQPLLAQAEAAGLETGDKLNVPSLAQLRGESSEDLMSTTTGMRGPIIDGYVLPEQIVSIFEKDQQNQVDLMTGWNQEEGLALGPIRNADDFTKQMREQYGGDAEKLLAFYPAHDDAEASKSQLDLARDIIFGAQNYAWAHRQAESKKNKTFVYRFTRKVPGMGQYEKYGAFHTGEVPYALSNLDFVNRPWEETDQQLANIMSNYWANFVKSGDPNGKGLPKWPQYQLKEKQVMILGDPVKAKPIPDSEALDLIYSLIIKPLEDAQIK